MILNINVDDESFELDVPQELINEVQPIITEMDKEFDQGCQLGRFWVDKPSDEQRCQIAANNIVNCMHTENKRMFYLMAAYILTKFPTIKAVTVNNELEIHEIDIQV